VVMESHGEVGCFVTRMPDCKFNMRHLQSLDFDVRLSNCYGTWAAPLWLTPDKWVGPGGKSGEIDMVELCPNTHVYSNFAGAQEPEGLQVRWPNADPNNFDGHVSMWVEPGSKPQVKVKMCSAEQAANNAGSCHKANAAFYSDIFGSHACADGDCEYMFVSDIWNGLGGDAGFDPCTQHRGPSHANCGFSVRNIKVRGPSFDGKCAALTGNTPTSRRRRSGGAWKPCTGSICCNPYSSPAQLCPDGETCQACGGGDSCQCPGASDTVVV